MGFLTTHVLDTARGMPAAGVRLRLYRDRDGALELVAEAVTNQDGRCEEPILNDDAFAPGSYELHFEVGDYFRAAGVVLDEPAFIDRVPIRFGMTEAGGHYHVPLLVSPYGYSTYRGS
jgi:5-hydroxyisourate hydrolase